MRTLEKVVDRIVLSEVSMLADVSQERKRDMKEYYEKNKNELLRDQKKFREKYPVERRRSPGGVSRQRRK